MTHKFHPEPCPVCGSGDWEPRENGFYTFNFGRKSHVVTGQHYAICNKCETRGYLPGQRDANRELIREFQSNLPEYVSASDILKLREKYLLTQEQAGLMFGGGKQAFSKWECGKTVPAGPTARLIKLAIDIPDVIESLAKKAGISLQTSPGAYGHLRFDKPEFGFVERIINIFSQASDQSLIDLPKILERAFNIGSFSNQLKISISVRDASSFGEPYLYDAIQKTYLLSEDYSVNPQIEEESLKCSTQITQSKTNSVLVANLIYPHDSEVLETEFKTFKSVATARKLPIDLSATVH